MRLFRQSFVWQFAGGFVLGALGLFAMQGDARATLVAKVAAVAQAG